MARASELSTEERKEIRRRFSEAVNMTVGELRRWLDTPVSHEVGQKSGGGESVGHRSGQRILEIKEKTFADLTDDDHRHMRKVAGYVARHLAQRPSGDPTDTRWRWSLMNWGHDPLK